MLALLGDAQGLMGSALPFVYLLPIVWLALYGVRSHVIAGLAALAVGPGAPDPRRRTSALSVRRLAGGRGHPGGVPRWYRRPSWPWCARDRAYSSHLAQRTEAARRSEAAALDSRAQLEALLAAATSTAVIGADPTGMVTFFSGGAERMLGYRAEEVVGRHSVYDFGDPDELHARREEIRAVMAAAGAPPPRPTAPAGRCGPSSARMAPAAGPS